MFLGWHLQCLLWFHALQWEVFDKSLLIIGYEFLPSVYLLLLAAIVATKCPTLLEFFGFGSNIRYTVFQNKNQ